MWPFKGKNKGEKLQVKKEAADTNGVIDTKVNRKRE